MMLFATLALTTMLQGAAPTSAREAQEIRVKIGNLCDIRNLDSNFLIGFGLVTGLQGTGDQMTATKQALANSLRLFGVNLTASDLASANTAYVTVTATLDPFRAKGAKVDVKVSALEAKSLAGGELLRAELLGPDGKTYVIAQGSLSIGGGFQGVGQAATVTKGHLTVASAPNGGLVVEEVPVQIVNDGGFVKFDLRSPDFTTAKRVADGINAIYQGSAEARSAGEIWVRVPEGVDPVTEIVEFVATIQEIEVVPQSLAVIVINERTGTLVSGENVKIARAGIAHGPLTISIEESPVVSQPPALSGGETVEVPRTNIVIDEKTKKDHPHAKLFPGAVSVAELVNALNALQVTPKDMIAILQLLKRAGALHAELVII